MLIGALSGLSRAFEVLANRAGSLCLYYSLRGISLVINLGKPMTLAWPLLLLLAFTAFGQGRYFRIVEGDRYQFGYQSTFSVGGTAPSGGARDGITSILVADVNSQPDSLWFTLRVEDTSLNICTSNYFNHCAGFPPPPGGKVETSSYSISLLYARGILFIPVVGQGLVRYSRTGNGSLNRVPRFLADTGSSLDEERPDYRSKSDSVGKGILMFKDPIETSYFLAGIGPVYDKHSSWIGFQTATEKFSLISHNGIPFRLEDHLTVDDPVPIREYPNPKSPYLFHVPNIDLLGRKIAIPNRDGSLRIKGSGTEIRRFRPF